MKVKRARLSPIRREADEAAQHSYPVCVDRCGHDPYGLLAAIDEPADATNRVGAVTSTVDNVPFEFDRQKVENTLSNAGISREQTIPICRSLPDLSRVKLDCARGGL